MVLLKLIALCCIGYCLDLINGHPEQLPEDLTAVNKNNSACYGTHTHFQPSCPSERVIAIQEVNVGAKLKSLNCLKEVNDFTPRNDSCCTPDKTKDCISVYSYDYAGIDYTFHKNCTGNQKCKHPFPVVNAITGCDRDGVYMDNTNYMYMDYACIETSRIGRLCENNNYPVSSGTFYLQSDNYPNSNYYGISTCTCHVQALTDVTGIYFYTLDVRLADDTRDCEQSLSVSDGEGYTNTTYDCSSATKFNITKLNMSQNAWITLKNTLNTTLPVTASDVYVWIGIQAKDNGSLSISCSVNYSIPPTTTTAQTPPGPRLNLIIGITVAALLFLILLIIILICCTKKKKKRKIASKEPGFSSKEPKTLNSMPKNIVFSKTQTPSDSLKSHQTSHSKEDKRLSSSNNGLGYFPVLQAQNSEKTILPFSKPEEILSHGCNIRQNNFPPLTHPQRTDIRENIDKNILSTKQGQDKLSSGFSNQRHDTDVIVNYKTGNKDDIKVTGITFPPLAAVTKLNEDFKLDELDENVSNVKSSEEELKRKHRKKKRKKRKARDTLEPSDQYVLGDQVIGEQSLSNISKQEQESVVEDILLNQTKRKKKKRKTRKEDTDKIEPTDQNDFILDNTV